MQLLTSKSAATRSPCVHERDGASAGASIEPVADLSETILAVLRPELGPHTSAQALRVACKKAKLDPDRLIASDLPALAEHISRMCRTLLGKRRSDALVEQMREAVRHDDRGGRP